MRSSPVSLNHGRNTFTPSPIVLPPVPSSCNHYLCLSIPGANPQPFLLLSDLRCSYQRFSQCQLSPRLEWLSSWERLYLVLARAYPLLAFCGLTLLYPSIQWSQAVMFAHLCDSYLRDDTTQYHVRMGFSSSYTRLILVVVRAPGNLTKSKDRSQRTCHPESVSCP